MMESMCNKEVKSLMSLWLHVDRHYDIQVIFEALLLFMKQLVYIEFNDQIKVIHMLLSVPRPSVAANAISLCLFNLLRYDEIIVKVIVRLHD